MRGSGFVGCRFSRVLVLLLVMGAVVVCKQSHGHWIVFKVVLLIDHLSVFMTFSGSISFIQSFLVDANLDCRHAVLNGRRGP